MKKIKTIIEVILLIALFGYLAYFGWLHSPLCAPYYYKKGKELFNLKQYDAAVRVLERSLYANHKNPAARYYYVLSLINAAPTYGNQESLYLMAKSETKDSAQALAQSKIMGLKRQLIQGVEDNYIYSAILNKDILRWNMESFPLRVYFEPSGNTPSYYREYIKNAFGEWISQSGFLQFVEVQDPKENDIIIQFSNYDGVSCPDGDCKYVVALTSHKRDERNRLTKMTIKFYNTDPKGKPFTQAEVYNTALHEIGHALGIMGHSDNPDDIMYASNHKVSDYNMASSVRRLSMRDLNTVALLYKLAPTITNMKGWYHSNLYYPPLIIGNEDEVLQKKLEEYQKYVNDFPNYCGGYINIATVYSSMGNNKLAMDNLDTAESYATNNDERYLIKYNKAVLYYNSQNFKTALEFAQDAKNIRNDEQINNLINEIQSVLNDMEK